MALENKKKGKLERRRRTRMWMEGVLEDVILHSDKL